MVLDMCLFDAFA
ncbi:hypothetical protein FG064_19410 [Vibrio cholerae]|nr:hypothetical protein [Vibrio cholerae]